MSKYKVGDKVRLTGWKWNRGEAKKHLGGVGSVVTVDAIGDFTGHGYVGAWDLELKIVDGWETELVVETVTDSTSELSDLIRKIGETNGVNGFNRTPEEARDSDYLSNKLLLIVSEVVEAQDEIRNGHSVDFTYYTKDGKPEGFVSELADVFIRVLGTVHELGIEEEFLKIVPEKLEYNKGRGYRHGKKF